MRITEVTENKKRYLSLLLLGDEQESMLDRYLARGRMFLLSDPDPRGECVVTDEGGGLLELKNLAIAPSCQRRGYGRSLVEYICRRFSGQFHTLQAGTGESTLPFYLACGFSPSHRVPGFFTTHYDHPIFEDGRQLIDMIYLRRPLSKE